MKNYIFLIAFWWCSSAAFSQELPREIMDFYGKYNFVSTLATDGEIEKISFHLAEDQLPPEMDTDRLSRVHQYLQDIYPNLYPSHQMPNGISANHQPLTLGFLDIKDWEIDGNVIRIFLDNLTLSREAKRYFIQNYRQKENKPEWHEIINQKKHLHGQVTQTWYLSDGVWKKESVNKILVNLN